MLRRAVIRALQLAGRASEARLTVRLTDDAELRELNRRFRGFNRTTDVLSFPSPADGSGYLGDIAISIDTVQRRLPTYGHSMAAEVALLGVHGALHLVGYDHDVRPRRRAMRELTLEALNSCGIMVGEGRL